MAKLRVYELAKELGLTNKECIDLCNALGYGVKSHSSSLDGAYADQVRRKAEREGLIRDQQPEEPAKKGSKKAAAAPAAEETPAPAQPAPEPVPAPAPEPVAEAPVAPVAAEPVVPAAPTIGFIGGTSAAARSPSPSTPPTPGSLWGSITRADPTRW